MKILAIAGVAPFHEELTQDKIKLVKKDQAQQLVAEKKLLKFMSKQDRLAVTAAHLLMSCHPLSKEELESQTGLYVATGYSGFEAPALQVFSSKSQSDGSFNYQSFISHTYPSFNPLLTFHCLPSMALFHCSHQLGIRKNYLSTYPSATSFASILEYADLELKTRKLKYAIVGSAFDANNPLTHLVLKKWQIAPEKAHDTSLFFLLSLDASEPLAEIGSFKHQEVSSYTHTEKYLGVCELPWLMAESVLMKKSSTLECISPDLSSCEIQMRSFL
jgi:hypothetical protein